MKRLIEETQKEYALRREKATAQAQARKGKAFAKIEGLSEIEDEIARLGIAMLESLHVKEGDKQELLKKMEELKLQKKQLLKSAGQREEDFLPDFKCKKCDDSGMTGTEVCICFKQQVAAKLYGEKSLLSVLERENFDTFNFELYSNKAQKGQKNPRQNIKKISSDCLHYTASFGRESGNLIFTGAPGVGKTFMINCIVAELLQKGVYVVYMTAYDLIDLLRKSKLSEYAQTIDSSFVDALYTCDLLAIDDLGTENATDFAVDEFFNLLNKRLLDKRQIILSTNLNLNELNEMYSDRILSRIMGYFTPYEFVGGDLRLKLN